MKIVYSYTYNIMIRNVKLSNHWFSQYFFCNERPFLNEQRFLDARKLQIKMQIFSLQKKDFFSDMSFQMSGLIYSGFKHCVKHLRWDMPPL